MNLDNLFFLIPPHQTDINHLDLPAICFVHLQLDLAYALLGRLHIVETETSLVGHETAVADQGQRVRGEVLVCGEYVAEVCADDAFFEVVHLDACTDGSSMRWGAEYVG